jgi:hypothetical protein
MHGPAATFYPMTDAVYISPISFSVAYTSQTTLTLAGLPFVPTNAQFAELRVTTVGGATNVYPSVSYNFSFNSGTNVLTVTGGNFVASDLAYRLVIVGNPRAYNQAADYYRFAEVDPLSGQNAQTALAAVTNITTATNYPSDFGIDLGGSGVAHFSLNGRLVDADATIKIEVFATDDINATPASRRWVKIYGLRADTGAEVSAVVAPSATVDYCWIFNDCRYKFIRVTATPDGVTNTNTFEINLYSAAI